MLIITGSLIDVGQSSKKRRRHLRHAADALADADTIIGIAGDVLIISGVAAEAGAVLKAASEASLIAARLLRILAHFVFCDLPIEIDPNPTASTPAVYFITADGLAVRPQNITHAPPGACVSIHGEGFDPDPTGNHVTIGSEDATVSLSNATWLRVGIPYSISGLVGVSVTTVNGTSPPFAFTVDSSVAPPEPVGTPSSRLVREKKKIIPLVKSEVEQVWLEEPEAFNNSGVNKSELISYLDATINLLSDFENEHFPSLNHTALYKMDSVVLAWPPDIFAELGVLFNELKIEHESRSANELFGPRLDKLLLKMYPSADAEFTALENGDIDIIDSPLTEYWITRWSSPPYNENIVLSFYGNGWKAYRRQYTGGNAAISVTPDDGENIYRGRDWEGIVNQAWFGVNSWGTFLNAHPSGFERGDGQNMTIRYGLSSPSLYVLNPIYSPSYWDWQVLDKIYDTLIIRNAFEPSLSMPWLAADWDIGDWVHPVKMKELTRIRFCLRSEATWTDGKPITVADVVFTFFELPHILETRGFPPPSWIGSVQEILDFKILDPYTFEVLLDTLDASAADAIGESIILPKHVWKQIVETGDPTSFAPDPNMVGSGPWRFVEYEPFNHVLMVANRPRSNVTTNLPTSTSITSPQGYWRYNPLIAGWKIDTENLSKIDYYTQPHTINFTVTNLALGWPITMDIDFQITWHNGTTTQVAYINVILQPSGQPGDTCTLTYVNILQGRIKIGSVFIFHDPPEFVCLSNTSKIMWATIKEDIVGSTFYDDISLPTYAYKSQLPSPDIKVDVKDVATTAKAFGTIPGHKRWSPIADINRDHKVDVKDISAIAKKFGWKG